MHGVTMKNVYILPDQYNNLGETNCISRLLNKHTCDVTVACHIIMSVAVTLNLNP